MDLMIRPALRSCWHLLILVVSLGKHRSTRRPGSYSRTPLSSVVRSSYLLLWLEASVATSMLRSQAVSFGFRGIMVQELLRRHSRTSSKSSHDFGPNADSGLAGLASSARPGAFPCLASGTSWGEWITDGLIYLPAKSKSLSGHPGRFNFPGRRGNEGVCTIDTAGRDICIPGID